MRIKNKVIWKRLFYFPSAKGIRYLTLNVVQCCWFCEVSHCGVLAQSYIFLLTFIFFLQMLYHCSLRSAVTVVGVKSGSLTPRSNWRSWRKNMQPANSSPKTREGASQPPPTSQSVKSPSGSKTGESRRRNLSVNPRTITCTPLDNISDLLQRATHTFQNIMPYIYLLHRKSWLKNILAECFLSFFFFSL